MVSSLEYTSHCREYKDEWGVLPPLGVAPTYTFLVYAAAVGAYFKGGQLSPIDLVVEERFHRAAPGGTGGTKAAGNYSPVSPDRII